MSGRCQHKDRPNVLSMPSLGEFEPHCCRECWDAKPLTDYKGKREAWECGSDYTRSGESVWYDSTRGRVQIEGFDERIWK